MRHAATALVRRARGVLLAGALMAGTAWAAPEALTVPTAGLSSSPAPLRAFLFMPEGTGVHPAIVLMHGCGGAYARDGSLNARHRMWGDYLASLGYAALLLDSFS